ncbi:alpha/beta fold hydrolase [Nocardia asteroides]|uniref:alpha/beta fold hydrolase n=1 Tax=Nocardia asteroides TaxID=1824 RepID=UPI001E2BFCB5|nr:alpha/beta hydrolase [Nocardia asteroides]UGT63423.1 alpha/beta hydrolase [Nocardia asteroides]
MTTFSTWDGLELSYRVWAGHGIPIVLQHGVVADTNANWMGTGVVNALRATGRPVVSLDARGHGRSAKPHEPAAYSWQAMARDVRALYDELGGEQFDQVGYSMGAVVSLLVAGDDPRVRRLAIGGVGSGVVDCGGVDRRVVDADDLRAAMAGDGSGATARARPFRLLADAVHADREAMAALMTGLDERPIGDLADLTLPVLVLAGDTDPLAAEPERLAAALPDAHLVTVPGDHLMAVTSPDFHRALVGFLAAERVPAV